MRLLWLCNKCIPAVARQRGMEIGNREGWLAGISEQLLQNKNADLEFGICFPVKEKGEEFTDHGEIHAYAFYENLEHPECYEEGLEASLKRIVEDFKPDLVHIFGTEFPHTLAMTRVFPYPERLLIGIQGLCCRCAERYYVGLPESILKKFTLRDKLKKDSISEQRDKFFQRGVNEIEAIRNVGNITGRTEWDREETLKINPAAKYYPMNETLRKEFYSGQWEYSNCKKHSIFISQGDYPIKGFHVFLDAFSIILEKYPDAIVYIAGQDIVGIGNLKKTVLISGYGKYLKKQIKSKKLNQNIIFCHNLNAQEMKEQFLSSHVFVLCSTLENSPNALGEAMLLGVPCVASDVGGVSSMISEEEGWLYSDCDANKLAEAIIQSFEETDREQGMTERQQKGMKHVGKMHDGKQNFDTLMRMYSDIL